LIPLGRIGIGLVVAFSGLAVISVAIYVVLKWRCPSYVSYTPLRKPQSVEVTEVQPSNVSEDRAKPQGYFALDPILRAGSDGTYGDTVYMGSVDS
jgi:hypothetical protein